MSLGLGAGLSACTMQTAARPNQGLNGSVRNLVVAVTPDKGEGASYRQGEAVRLRVGVQEPGYLTLVARQPNGSAQVLVRDVPLERGTYIFPRDGQDDTFAAALKNLPQGRQAVRAIFTRQRPATELVVTGVYDQNRWNAVGYQDFRQLSAADRDVQETYFQIVP